MGAALVPGRDVPCASWVLELEKGTLSREQLPSSPCGCCASVRAGKGSPFNVLVRLLAPSRSLSQKMACDGAEHLQWDSHWQGGTALVELMGGSCMVPTSWSCGKSGKLHH